MRLESVVLAQHAGVSRPQPPPLGAHRTQPREGLRSGKTANAGLEAWTDSHCPGWRMDVIAPLVFFNPVSATHFFASESGRSPDTCQDSGVLEQESQGQGPLVPPSQATPQKDHTSKRKKKTFCDATCDHLGPHWAPLYGRLSKSPLQPQGCGGRPLSSGLAKGLNIIENSPREQPASEI